MDGREKRVREPAGCEHLLRERMEIDSLSLYSIPARCWREERLGWEAAQPVATISIYLTYPGGLFPVSSTAETTEVGFVASRETALSPRQQRSSMGVAEAIIAAKVSRARGTLDIKFLLLAMPTPTNWFTKFSAGENRMLRDLDLTYTALFTE